MLTLLATLGLRRGELLGLQWRDVDFANGRITVCRNVTYTAQKGVCVGPTKTEKGERVLPLPSGLARLLASLRAERGASSSRPTNFLFPGKGGLETPRDPNALTRKVKTFLEKNGLPVLSPHDLRHPYVKPTTKKFLSFFKFEMAISLRAFLCFALLLGIKEGPQLVPFIR